VRSTKDYGAAARDFKKAAAQWRRESAMFKERGNETASRQCDKVYRAMLTAHDAAREVAALDNKARRAEG
jgi:hypothetical protein